MKHERRRKRSLGPRALIFTILFSLAFGSAAAQTEMAVSGKIVDSSGEPIVGALVMNPETGRGATSNTEGAFSLTVPEGSLLEITFLGYKTASAKAEGRGPLLIALEQEQINLDEVVVVGYATQKKESLTGAISNIRSKDIVSTKSNSLAQAIQGKVAGLRIRQSDGEPGKFNSDIAIRGFGTPLFVVDGILRDGADYFQRLNPEDIESISFLKDGTAAIYGMNSANGAIIVTTKKGSAGRTRININSNVGFSTPTATPQMLNAAQYMEMRNDAAIFGTGSPYLTREELTKWQNGESGYEGVDFYDAVFKNSSFQQQHTLSFDGGNDRVTFYGSLGYVSEDGLLRSGDMRYEKFSFRANSSIKLAKGLSAGINVGGRMETNKSPWDSAYEIFKQVKSNVPTGEIYANGNDKYYATQLLGTNPLAISNADVTGYRNDYNKNIQTTFSLQYDMPFVPGLYARAQLGYDYSNYRGKGLRKKYSTYSYSEDTDSYTEKSYNNPSLIQVSNSENDRIDFQAQIGYARKFNDAHNLSAAVVFENRRERNNSSFLERKYDVYTVDEIDHAGLTDQITKGMSGESAFLSYIGRVNYDYKGKYLVELAARYDGSYRYAPENRWALFPLGSVGWRISEENFVKDNVSFIDNLKLRFSYGKSGEDQGKAFQHISGYTLGVGYYEFENGTVTSGVATPQDSNTNLSWLTIHTMDLGLDASLWNGKLSLEFDIYQRTRKGLPATRSAALPNTFGAQQPEENLQSDMTRGIEFTIGHRNRVGQFEYGFSGNLNFARSKITYHERSEFNSSWDRWRNSLEGRYNNNWKNGDWGSQGNLWGYNVTGQYQTVDQVRHGNVQGGSLGNYRDLPGDWIYEDTNGDGIIDDKDKMPIFWGRDPLIQFGFSIDMSWKGLDFYALFQGAGLYSVRFEETYGQILNFKGQNTPTYFYDRWHKADPYDPSSEWVSGEWPAARLIEDAGSMYLNESTAWRRNVSYLRLKTIELGYTLPQRWTRKAMIERLRVFVNCYNLLTFCDPFIKPFDPEKIEGSYNAGLTYPLMKSFNFGLNITF